MKRTLISLLFAGLPLHAQDELFRERFADPATRSAARAALIPGTQAAYFHTALDHQLAGREAEFDKTIAEWKAASERGKNRISNAGLSVLTNRQLLKDYQKNPTASRVELIDRLGLTFDDARPDAAAAAETLPTRLAPELVTEEVFEKAAAAKNRGQAYPEYSGERLLRELEKVKSFNDEKIRWFFKHLERADLPGVVPLVDRALELDSTLPFDKGLLRKLTVAQLRALLESHPELRGKESFALAYLAKLRPGAETDFERDPQSHAAHLQLCRDFVLTLPPALNSLKAHVLFHHLRLQAEMGNFPKEDFLAYLALPRGPSKGDLFKSNILPSGDEISLIGDFFSATGCSPIDDEDELAKAYLYQYLSHSDSAADFEPFIEKKTLVNIHARARLLGGGDPAVWGKLLDASEFKSLQENAEITFASGTPDQLAADAAVALSLDLKNTPELLVRIYELDLPSHLANHGGEPQVDIDLDGLVPHHERRISYAQAPILRHRETIDLPELGGPGAWIVEFTGGQVSARALIRKGRLIAYPERTATGQTLRVFDEKSDPVTTASLTLGRENFTADATGRIVIPNAPNQPVTQGILRAGKLATSVTLESRSDELAMDARFFLDREQLLADQEAKLHLRVQLTNHDRELPLDRIKDPALLLRAKLLGGVTTERVIAENLTLAPVMEIPFQVPADLLELTLTLRGTVMSATGGEPVKLSKETVYQINDDLKTSRVGTAFFSQTSEGHRLEVRGRNGEPLASRALTLDCRREGIGTTVKVPVRTDAQGRVDLGKLDGIVGLMATGSDIAPASYDPKPRDRHYPDIRLGAGAEIRIPAEAGFDRPDQVKLSLLEVVNGGPIRDHFEKISYDAGDLVIRGLPPGEFRLRRRERDMVISVSSAVEKDGLLISKTRIMPYFVPRSVGIRSAAVEGDRIRVRLQHPGPEVRLILVGKRYQQEWNYGLARQPFLPPIPDTITPGFTGNAYLTDRMLSDETRYILDRRAAKTFPGSLLPRPGLLLNRWTDTDLKQDKSIGEDGVAGQGRGSSFGTLRSSNAPRRQDSSDRAIRLASACDFLAMPSVVRFDLKPEADGTLSVPLADFAGCQFIEIIANDTIAADTFRLPLPANDTPLRDRRIARPLDPQAHYLADRSAAVLQKGAEATIENLLDADWRAFTTFDDAHQFLYGMTGDDRLREFVFLTEWPNLTEEKKLELLANHACHELHLFLARKDTAFFDKYVKPQLAGKPEPRFMDDYLLGRDLTTHLRPYAWQRLNAAEKALLAQAMPAARERVSRELSLRWQLEAPSPDLETTLFAETLRGSDLALQDSLGLAKRDLRGNSINGAFGKSEGVDYIMKKLEEIIIPRIDFEDTTVEEALDFLRLRASELDTAETDPAKRGFGLVLRRPRPAAVPEGGVGDAAELPLSGADPGQLRVKNLQVRNVPLGQALKYICEQTKLRYKVDDYGITLVPATEAGDEIFTRTFQVPPDFRSALDGGDEGGNGAAADPFAEAPQGGGKPKPAARRSIQELLRRNGIVFGQGSSATLTGNGTLIVTNTPEEIDKIEQLSLAVATNSSHMPESTAPGFAGLAPAPASAAAADPFASSESGNLTNGLRSGDQAINRNNIDAILNNPSREAADPFADSSAAIPNKPVARKPLPTFPDRTKLWREANYYHNTKRTDESLIPLNRFWLDLAAWDGKGPFLSPHFNACHTNGNEALMCLALLDLPFKADRPEVSVDGSTLRVKAREPMLLYYKDTRKTENVTPESPLLVRQTFSPQDEPFRTVEGRQVENPVTGDFRPGVAYAASLIVTNPTGIGRRIDLLAQIPAGAIPLGGTPATESSTHELEPYGVVTESLAFYFPAAGDFAVYPLHVSENGSVLAHTDQRTLRVSNDPAPQDAASWQVLAREGGDAEVLARLATENLNTIDLSAIRWRLKDAAFFQSVTKLLRERLYFSADVSSYGFYQNDVAAMREYLENSASVNQLGEWLDSPLLEVRPRVHLAWETLEFDPLVNPRAHRFGDKPRLTHEAAREHYLAFLSQLGWKSALDDSDQLNLAALLFLQDRIEEALARFDRIDPAKLPGRMNYDYLHAVVLFLRENPAEAKAIAARVLPALPPGLWRDRFQAVVDQAEEIAALAGPGAEEKPVEETAAPELDLELADGGKLRIKHRSLEKTTLRMFSVDLEVLFSKNPFLQGDGDQGGQPAILPNGSFEVALAKDVQETTVELPEGLKKGNVLVSADSGSKKLLKVLDSRAIELRHTPQDRIVRVLDAGSHKPLPKTYVKVYAESNSGEVVFHKDGYTDLRGEFDYLNHTGINPATIKRVAILVAHPEKGARTVIYDR